MNLAQLYGKPPGVSDDQARRTIEFCCPITVEDNVEWYQMEAVANLNLDDVTDALQWLNERADNTIGFRVVRDGNRPSLIRFEARP